MSQITSQSQASSIEEKENDMSAFLASGAAALELGISQNTLRKWADQGLIQSHRTVGGHRRYDVTTVQVNQSWQKVAQRQSNLNNFNKARTAKAKIPQEGKTALYCRVSSYKQKNDLQRQIQALQFKYPQAKVYQDICSGLKYNRKGLTRLLEHVQAGVVQTVVVAHKDRLARFGVELIHWIITQAGANLILESQTSLTPQQEVTDDLMAILHVFSCRANGKRRYKNPQQSGKVTKSKTLQGSKRQRQSSDEAGATGSNETSSDTKPVDSIETNESPARLATPLV